MEKKKPETKLMAAIFYWDYATDWPPLSDDDLHDSIDGVSLKDALLAAIDTLSRSTPSSPVQSSRVKRVIMARFGLDDGRSKTQREVGEEFGVSKNRIFQIEARGLRQLRHPSRSHKLKRYIKKAAATRD